MKTSAVFSFFIIVLFLVSAFSVSLPAASATSTGYSDQAADIEQGTVYTWISTLFSTGYTATAAIPSGNALIQYSPDLLASASSVSEIQVVSMSGQVLSTATGPGYYAKDTFNFSFAGYSEYEILLYFNNATSGSSTIATTTNGVLAESQDGYVYDYSTNTASQGKVFTLTSNITSSDLQATIYITEKGAVPPPSDATIHFHETGLPSATSWTVSYHSVLNGYTGPNATSSSADSYINLTMAIGNVIYYWISDSAGLAPLPSNGIISLTGNTTVSVSFPTPSPASFSITFVPTGVPSGTTWGVTLQGQTLYNTNLNGQNPDVTFNEPDGTYSYSIYVPSPLTAQPPSGTVVVSGSSVTVGISISQPSVTYYSLTFTESGLPSGTDFTVSIGTAVDSGNPTASFVVPDGTYYYTIASVGLYTASPASGSVTVNGANINIAITFAQATYSVTFTESGLASGSSWGITFDGSGRISSTTSITYDSIAAGSYSYTATSSGYFTVTGSIAISGSRTVAISFSPSTVVTGAPSVGISSEENYLINGTLTAPSGYSLSQFTLLSVSASWNSSSKDYTMTPSPTFSLQVPALNTTYHLSFQLTGSDLISAYYNTSVTEEAARTVINSTIPSFYAFYPASGSVIYSSQTVGMFLKGNVTFTGILIYSSAYGSSGNISLSSKALSNGTQSLYYPLDINNFSEGQYNFKYLILYNGKVQTSLTAQYLLEAQNAITLKYNYSYSGTLAGSYNVSFNITVHDSDSIKYSPVNLLNVSLNGNFWFLSGRPEIINGTTRDYFLLTVDNLAKGTYALNLTAFNRTGNIPYEIFTTSYNFSVPSLVPSSPGLGGFQWSDVQGWFMTGYNGYIVGGAVLILMAGAVIAYNSGRKKLGAPPLNAPGSNSQKRQGQGINIRIFNSDGQKKSKSRRSK